MAPCVLIKAITKIEYAYKVNKGEKEKEDKSELSVFLGAYRIAMQDLSVANQYIAKVANGYNLFLALLFHSIWAFIVSL